MSDFDWEKIRQLAEETQERVNRRRSEMSAIGKNQYECRYCKPRQTCSACDPYWGDRC